MRQNSDSCCSDTTRNTSIGSPMMSPRIQLDIADYPKCLKYKDDVRNTKEVWRKHCRSEVENNVKKQKDRFEEEKKRMEENFKKQLEEYGGENEILKKSVKALSSNIEEAKRKNSEFATGLERALHLIKESREYRREVEELQVLLEECLHKQNMEVACQMDGLAGNVSEILERIKQVDSKKVQLDEAVALASGKPTGRKLLEPQRASRAEAQPQPKLHSDAENGDVVPQKNHATRGRCATLSPDATPSPPSISETGVVRQAENVCSDPDSDIEFIEEVVLSVPQNNLPMRQTLHDPRAVTPEKNTCEDRQNLQRSAGSRSRGVKRRLLSGKENDSMSVDSDGPGTSRAENFGGIMEKRTCEISNRGENKNTKLCKEDLIGAFSAYLVECNSIPSNSPAQLVENFVSGESYHRCVDLAVLAKAEMDALNQTLLELADAWCNEK